MNSRAATQAITSEVSARTRAFLPDTARSKYLVALAAVIAINAVMFIVELAYGVRANSLVLLADAWDFLLDAGTYTLSLWAVLAGAEASRRAAQIKAICLLTLGIGIIASAVYGALFPRIPDAATVGWVSIAALAANLSAVAILAAWRDGDANMRSVWLCSRNDAVRNLGMLISAALVAATGSHWPDVMLAAAIGLLFVHSAVEVYNRAQAEEQTSA